MNASLPYVDASDGDVVVKMQTGATPLFIAAQKCHKEVVEVLIKEGRANVNAAKEVSYPLIVPLTHSKRRDDN